MIAKKRKKWLQKIGERDSPASPLNPPLNQLSINKVNQISKLRHYESSYTLASCDSGCTPDADPYADVYYSDKLHLTFLTGDPEKFPESKQVVLISI